MAEAAFEAAVSAASLSLRNRHDVVVSLAHGASDKLPETIGATSDPNIRG
jgi:hypothetical protein